MKKSEVLRMYETLLTLDNQKQYKARFSYMLAKNKKILKDEYDIIVGTAPKLSEEYESQRMTILNENMERDENGETIWANRENRLPKYKDIHKLNEEIVAFETKFKTELEDFNIKNDDFKKSLNDKVKIDFDKIHLNDLDEFMSPEDMDKIFPFIKED